MSSSPLLPCHVVIVWRWQEGWWCLSPLEASEVDLLFFLLFCILRGRLFFNCWWSPRSAMSFLLAWPVPLPGGTWSGVFWSLCNVPTDWPHQVSASYFSSLALPRRSFSPSSPLMLGMRLFWICPPPAIIHVIPFSKASCKPSVSLLGTDVQVAQGGDSSWGQRVAGVCAGGTFRAPPFSQCWVHSCCPSLVEMRGQKPGEALGPLVAISGSLCFISYKSPAQRHSRFLGKSCSKTEVEKLKLPKVTQDYSWYYLWKY